MKVGFRSSCNILIDEFPYILVKVCYLVVLYDLKRAGDNETEAVNALPRVVEEVPWGTEQQLLDQAQAGCESLLIKDDEVKKSTLLEMWVGVVWDSVPAIKCKVAQKNYFADLVVAFVSFVNFRQDNDRPPAIVVQRPPGAGPDDENIVE